MTDKNIYYTQDHEWVDFHERVAYTGVCRFKLTGFKEVCKIAFQPAVSGFKKQGTLLAVIANNDFQIEAYMPVDGEVMQTNDKCSADPMILLNDPEGEGWIALIEPSAHSDMTRLLSREQYRQKNG